MDKLSIPYAFVDSVPDVADNEVIKKLLAEYYRLIQRQAGRCRKHFILDCKSK
jgi:hypothetical protein